jgi:serine phosphatase RsbU (regulator of sigma subunit)
MILAFIRFAHWFTHLHPPRLLYVVWLIAAPIALVASMALDSDLPFWAFVLLSLVDLLRCLRRKAARPHPGNWVVAMGGFAILLAALIQTLINIASAVGVVIPGVDPDADIYSYGMLGLFLAISIYLSWRYSSAQRDLEERLREVEALSARTLEQEREAREREVGRRLLEADNARKTEELDAARRLQLSLLPATLPDLPDVEVAFAMRTATEVGGDYYDYRSENGALTLGIGDATGHGADAGILVATVKGLFHTTRLEHGLRPALDRVSEGVAGLGLKRHHMSLALLRYSAGAVRFAAAGMPPLLVHRAATGEVEEILLEAPPLGVIYDRPYPELKSRVEPGDTLLLTTDGLAERRNDRDELFGYERLRAAFASWVRLDVSVIADRLFAVSDDWAGGTAQSDDMTAVVLRVRSVIDRLPAGDPSEATGGIAPSAGWQGA